MRNLVNNSKFSRQDMQEHGREQGQTVRLYCIDLGARGLTGRKMNSRNG